MVSYGIDPQQMAHTTQPKRRKIPMKAKKIVSVLLAVALTLSVLPALLAGASAASEGLT